MARLNDTRALVDAPAGEIEHSIRSRRVGEGYVVSTSTHNIGTGEYKCKEDYYSTPPRIIPGRIARSGPSSDAAGSRGLADTMNYMKEKGTDR